MTLSFVRQFGNVFGFLFQGAKPQDNSKYKGYQMQKAGIKRVRKIWNNDCNFL